MFEKDSYFYREPVQKLLSTTNQKSRKLWI